MLAVVGGQGFIGSNVARAFPSRVIDKFDDLDFRGCNAVVHLAANADVRGGWKRPDIDIQCGPVLTSRVLEVMRSQGVKRLIFASTGSVYKPGTHEHLESEQPYATSLYAASKIACEELIHAYEEADHIDATILRFVSVLGPHYSHGLLKDFVAKATETELPVLAPGTSQKSYIHVADVVDAMRIVLHEDACGTYNVGTNETATPLQIAQWTLDQLGFLDAKPTLEGETWVGDNPVIKLSNRKLRMLGWEPNWTIERAIKDTVRCLTS